MLRDRETRTQAAALLAVDVLRGSPQLARSALVPSKRARIPLASVLGIFSPSRLRTRVPGESTRLSCGSHDRASFDDEKIVGSTIG